MTNVKASLNLSTPVTVLAPAALTPQKVSFFKAKNLLPEGGNFWPVSTKKLYK